MTGIMIIGHGHFAGGMVSAIELIAGTSNNLVSVEFCAGQDVGTLKNNIVQAIEMMDAEDILLMVDILGGSPFNVAAQLLTEGIGKNLKVVAGVNMAAVIQAVLSCETVPFSELSKQALEAGKEGLVDLSALMPE